MSTLSLRLPQSIHHNAKLYAQRASAEKFAAALALVPDVPPIAGDELP